jgi:hypothetical protein
MQEEVQSYIGFKIQNIIGKTNIFDIFSAILCCIWYIGTSP